MRSRDRSVRNAIIVDVEIPAKLASKLLKRLTRCFVTAVVAGKIRMAGAVIASISGNRLCSRDPVELFGGQNLSPVVNSAIVPDERLGDMIVHPKVKVGHHYNRRLESLGQIERQCGHLEALFRGRGY